MMDTQEDKHISNAGKPLEQQASVGAMLREAREQMGLSVNDVANRIKFAPRQVEFLEADDYVRLPEAAFVRGFVRSYARLLELDPVRLIAGLPSSHVQPASAHEIKSVEIPMPTPFSARRHNIIWLAAALVIALSLAIFERMHDAVPEKTAIEPVVETAIQPLELPVETAEKAPEQLSVQDPAGLPVPPQAARVEIPPASVQPAPVQTVRPSTVIVPQQPVRPVPAPVPAAPPQTVRVAPAAAPAPATQQTAAPKADRPTPVFLPWQPYTQSTERTTTAAAAPAASTGTETTAAEHSLRIEFDEDAWVEVKDASEKILISRMHTAGSLVRVRGKAPLQVTIGNARAVRLFDNGKKINLERYTSAEVARVKLN